MRRNLII